MALDATVKKYWIETQKQRDVPVNALGVKIKLKDEATWRVWHDEGLDKFVLK